MGIAQGLILAFALADTLLVPRDIPVGNGTLLVTFDQYYRIRDIYYPYVGKENHSEGHPFRFGVWVDRVFSWVDAEGWQRALKYLDETLVSDVLCANAGLGIELSCNDAVDFRRNIYLRKVMVRNCRAAEREVRVFLHHDFYISETEVGDTAYFDPETEAIIHYKGNRYFLIGCLTAGGAGFDQYATGRKAVQGVEGTWRDAEDGLLSGNPISQGAVDSTIGINLQFKDAGEISFYYWIAVGNSYQEVCELNRLVLQRGPRLLMQRTADYWYAWVNKQELNFGNLPGAIIDHYKRSLLIVRTQIDNGGAIIAANDTDIAQFSRDTYSYMWPRDGALVAYALDLAGYSGVTGRFFQFCRDILHKDGYYLHKYNADRSPASSWHAWIKDGERQLPIQEDETALIVWALWHHFDQHRNLEFIASLYHPVITRAADFMAGYRDKETGLPLPSWDLWEERRGVMTFTSSAVWAGLQAASRFASLFGDVQEAERYQAAADEVKRGMIAHLYRPELKRFARMLSIKPGGGYEVDATIDASLCGIFQFGTFDAGDEMVVSTMRAIEKRLWAKTAVGGLARYENDYYHQVSKDISNVAGNPWFICTLWLAQYRIAKAATLEELESSLEILEWVISHALPSGVLAEQVHPYTGQPLSVSPLTWSHATVVMTVMEYLRKLERLVVCDNCGRPMFRLDRRGREIVSRDEDLDRIPIVNCPADRASDRFTL